MAVIRMPLRVTGLLALLLLAAAAPCADCTLPQGTYHTAAPPGWDGHAKLPLLIFLHGYGADGTDMLLDDAVGPPAAAAGFLLVAPDGKNHAWAVPGAPAEGQRDDAGFIRAVLADVERRWPVDRGMVVLGGFSLGGSMTWQIACTSPTGFTAFLPMSGGFWTPIPEHCVAPVALRHLHGVADPTVPLSGRVLRQRFRLADIAQGLAVFRRADRCAATPHPFTAPGGQDCTAWDGCAAGGVLQFCLHPGGHEMRADWTTAGLRWALGQRR